MEHETASTPKVWNVRLWGGVYALNLGLGSQLPVPDGILWTIHMMSAVLLACSITYWIPFIFERLHFSVRILLAFAALGALGFALLTFPFWNPLHQTMATPRVVIRVEELALIGGGIWLVYSGMARLKSKRNCVPQ